jgi:hypothetical protein
LRVVLPCSTHAPGSQQWRATRARPAAPHMDDPPCRLPYCTRTRGLHEWGAAARTTCPSSRVAAPVPSKDPFYRVFDRPREARSQAVTAGRRPRKWGAGAQPQYKPSSIKPASGSDLRMSTRPPAGSDLAQPDGAGCAPSMPSPHDPALGQFR